MATDVRAGPAVAGEEAQPYVGPRPFERRDAPRFFGRGREANELVSRVIAHECVLLYAQSGAGKTSLINARLLPLLEQEEQCDVLPVARVQGPLPDAVRLGEIKNVYAFHTLVSWAGGKADPRWLAGLTLAEFLRERRRAAPEDFAPPRVAVFDQFEELFTFYPDQWPHRREFFLQVRAAVEADPNLRVLFAMREDYIAELDPYVALLPESLRTRFRLERLREKPALAAVVEPLKDTERRFAPGVAEALVRDLLETEVDTPEGRRKIVEEFVEPVQLQVVCQSLWRSLGPGDAEITAEQIRKSADVGRALTEFYEDCLARVVREHGVKEGLLRRWFEEKLITPSGTRAMVFGGREDVAGMPNPVVGRLENLHLLRREQRAGAGWYELTHDRFLEPVRESNRRWRAQRSGAEQALRRLEARAAEWDSKGRGTEECLEEGELKEAERLLASPEVAELGASELLRSLVLASRHLLERTRQEREKELRFAEQQARSLRRLRWFAAGLALALLAAVGAVVFSVVQYQKARRARNEADEQTRLARDYNHIFRSRSLADRAARRAGTDPEEGAALTIEATREAGKFDPSRWQSAEARFHRELDSLADLRDQTLAEAEETLRSCLLQLRAPAFPAQATALQTASFTPDGAEVVTVASDRTVRVWNVRTRELARQRSVSPEMPSVFQVAVSPDGKYVAAVNGTLTAGGLWDLSVDGDMIDLCLGPPDGGDEKPRPPAPAGPPSGTAKDVAGGAYGGRVADAPAGPPSGGSVVLFSHDSNFLATAGPGMVRVWATVSGEEVCRLTVAEKKAEGSANKGDPPKTPGPFLALAFSGDDRRFLGTTPDGTAYLWDFPRDRLLNDPRQGPVARALGLSLTFLQQSGPKPPARRGQAGPLPDLPAAAPAFVFRGPPAVVRAEFSPDPVGKYILTISADWTARLWDAANRKMIAQLSLLSSPRLGGDPADLLPAVREVKSNLPSFLQSGGGLSSDGKRLVMILPSNAQVYNLEDPRAKPVELRGHRGDSITTARFNPGNPRMILTASSDQTARLWEADTGRCLAELRGHSGRVADAQFSKNGTLVVTASSDKTARVWNVEELINGSKPTRSLDGPKGNLVLAALSPDRTLAVVAAADGTAWVWDTQTWTNKVALRGLPGPLTSAAFSQDNALLVTTSKETTARVWDVRTGSLKCPLAGNTGTVTGAAFSQARGSHRVATTALDNTVRVWDGDTGKAVGGKMTGYATRLTGAVFSPDDRYIIVANAGVPTEDPKAAWPGGQPFARVYEAATGKPVRKLVHGVPVTNAAFSPRGAYVLTAAVDQTVNVWDVDGWDKQRTCGPKNLPFPDFFASFSPNGYLIVGNTSYLGGARVWSAESGKLQVELRGHNGAINGVEFSPNSRFLVSAGADGTARVWEVHRGLTLGFLPGTGGKVVGAAFGPDNKTVLVVSQAPPARIYPCELCGSLDDLLKRARSYSGVREKEKKVRESDPASQVQD